LNEKLPVAACEVRAVRGVFLFLLLGVGRGGPCGVGLGSAVFILNGMIFSFLDEKRVFKGVV